MEFYRKIKIPDEVIEGLGGTASAGPQEARTCLARLPRRATGALIPA
jgi:hypothetical protein